MLKPGEIIVDSFAGGGGASLGIYMALGRGPDIAINHDAEAIALHRANHPESEHYTEDVFEVDPVKACDGRPVGLMWASPDCKHFSKAKGGKPVSPRVRSLAWVVVRWAAEVHPRLIALENVEEFQTWGPLTEAGLPCPARKGETFRAWRACLTTGLRRDHPAWAEIRATLGADWPHYDRLVSGLGYDFSACELRACDYGTPTIRKRLFVVMRCDGVPIVWPEPTHAPRGEMDRKPWRTAAECIDWTIPCPSIFERMRPLAENTLKRIARGIKRFVIDNPKPFIVPATHGAGERGPDTRTHDIGQPLRTIITRGAPFHLVAPVIAPLTHHGENRGQSADEPLPTVTAAHRGEQALVSAVLAGCGGRAGQSPERSLEQPYQTITAKADAVLVTPYMARIGQSGGNGGYVNSPDEPVTTVTTKAEHLLVTPILVGAGGPVYSGKPTSVEQPVGALMTENHKALATAFLAKHFGGHETPGADVSTPAPTVTAKDHNAVVAAHLMHNYTSNTNGGEGDPRKPAKTITAGGQHHALVKAFLVAYFGNERDGASVEDPMRTVTVRDRFGLVTIAGTDYVIVDIGMRMLMPRELYRAQGFPDSYKIEIEFNGKPMTKTAQVRMCGNSVCPPLACAIVRANTSQGVAAAA